MANLNNTICFFTTKCDKLSSKQLKQSEHEPVNGDFVFLINNYKKTFQNITKQMKRTLEKSSES